MENDKTNYGQSVTGVVIKDDKETDYIRNHRRKRT